MPLEINWPFPDFRKPHRLWNIGTAVVIPVVGTFSKIWIEWLNKVKVYNMNSLIESIEKRPSGHPLITVCNHHSCYDDPGLWGLLDWRILIRGHIMRWSGAASDICFTNPYLSKFFAVGQTVPIVRGEGVYERSIDFLIDRLNEGKWVHIFPEGKVNLTNRNLLRLKWGVGRMISECRIPPTLIPFWHIGMDDVLPNKTPYIPRIGKKVTVYCGKPISLRELCNNLNTENKSAMEKRKAITDFVHDKLLAMKEETERLHNLRIKC